MRRHTPIKRSNPKRRASEFRRCYGSRDRVMAIKALACYVCGRAPSENAHLPSRSGMGRKGDWTEIVDLCHACHRELHDCGSVEAFEAKHEGINLRERAAFLADFLRPA